jgi:hypothetical protein
MGWAEGIGGPDGLPLGTARLPAVTPLDAAGWPACAALAPLAFASSLDTEPCGTPASSPRPGSTPFHSHATLDLEEPT